MFRRVRVAFLRSAETGRSALNEPVMAWAVIGEAMAERTDMSDGERVAAGVEQSLIVARFVVRSAPVARALSGNDRLRTGGEAGPEWNIRGVKAVEGRPLVEILAERRSDGA